MAKHAHRIILISKKTWKCTLEGCSFFVHLGLAHVLVGKQAICWECNEQFTLDEYALRDEMPKCAECRSVKSGGPTQVEIIDFENHIRMISQMKNETKNKIEVISENENHSPDCDVFIGKDCTCK